MTENIFYGKQWTVEEMTAFHDLHGWSLFKGKHLWTAWREREDGKPYKHPFIVCKHFSSLVYWVSIASRTTIDCPACLNAQLGGCGHCRTRRHNHGAVLRGKVKDFDKYET